MTEEAPNNASESASPPRAFAQGTGILLQFVGVTMFLMTCCVCSTSFLWDPVQSPVKALDLMSHDPASVVADPAKRSAAIMIVAMSLGGLALASFGLGLQADRSRAGAGAFITTLLLFLVLISVGVGLWRGNAGMPIRIFHLILTLTDLILLRFCLDAWRQVRKDPPPAAVDVIPPGKKIPYNFYHDDPPEVRLANEIAERRQTLAEEQAALDKLEKDLKNKPTTDQGE